MSDRETLESQVLPCDWEALRPHHERESLLAVRPDLDLIEAALAMAQDRTDRIGVWLQVGRLGKPTAALVDQWQGKRFQMVIVQPWVLAQELPAQDARPQ